MALMNRRHILSYALGAWCVSALIMLLSPLARADELTFFFWSDQHVTPAGDAKHLTPAIDAMNGLAGTEYPPGIGGKVASPAFVFGCGDITEWPSSAARDAYNKAITERLKYPSFDIVGNHDEGGKVPRPTIKDWIIARHQSLSYTFDRGGVHFLGVYSEYDESLDNPAQPISKNALQFIRAELARIPKGEPAVVALHLCFAAITNRDELVGAFGDANVILVLGGHYHKATVNEYRGYRFVQAPSPLSTTMFTVIRIGTDRLVAIPYDYKAGKWVDNPAVRLDVPIKGIAGSAPAKNTAPPEK